MNIAEYKLDLFRQIDELSEDSLIVKVGYAVRIDIARVFMGKVRTAYPTWLGYRHFQTGVWELDI